MSTPRVPAVQGWFTVPDETEGPAAHRTSLIGTRCTASGTYFFPPERVMSRAPGFADAELEEVELSTRGTLWSYTDAQYQPPEPFIAPSDPYEPFCLAAVELEREGLVVLGQVVAGVDVTDLRVGMEMELVLDTLEHTEDAEIVIWKWQPVGLVPDPTDGD